MFKFAVRVRNRVGLARVCQRVFSLLSQCNRQVSNYHLSSLKATHLRNLMRVRESIASSCTKSPNSKLQMANSKHYHHLFVVVNSKKEFVFSFDL